MVVPTMDSLPRVPDTHGDTVDEKLFSDLYIRTSWFDASIALDQIEKVSPKVPCFFLPWISHTWMLGLVTFRLSSIPLNTGNFHGIPGKRVSEVQDIDTEFHS